MIRDLTIGVGLFLLVGLSYCLIYWKGGNDMEDKLLAADHGKLVQSTQEIVNIFHTLQTQASELDVIKENPPAGPNSSAAVDILYRNRKSTQNTSSGASREALHR